MDAALIATFVLPKYFWDKLNWNIPADTNQVGWGKGLWIPAAARMTGVGVKMGSRFPLRQE